MSQYIAAYDVSSNRQRDRVARVLAGHGERIQHSVFLVWLDTGDLPELRQEIGSLLEVDDRFDLFPVDTRPNRTRLTWQNNSPDCSPVIVLEPTGEFGS